ncbi:MAG: GNAT family N-acetyltransferase [Candidatus Omnitrophica bacterium]|nr:GNAT family N-acetyltransferase [Candidatus Omnitrophota bacterium]
MEMLDTVIRKYRFSDRQTVRRISLETAMMGQPAAAFFDGNEVFADALTLYFTDHEPESCFVAQVDGKVVGCLTGARDTRCMDELSGRKILWPLLWKAACSGIFLKGRNIRVLLRSLWLALGGGFFLPDFYQDYPATLHINVLDGYRASGVGGKLMEAYLSYLQGEKVRGVRMATMSEQAGHFFQTQGFSFLYRSTRPYFREVLKRDVPFLIYGKKFLT